MKKRIFKKLVTFIILVGMAAFACRQDIHIVNYICCSDKITTPVRLMLITDLHSCFYGKEQSRLIEMIDKQNPDVILLGGDIADDRRSDDGTRVLLENISRRYPCFYVNGNHEYWSEKIDEKEKMISGCGVRCLKGEMVEIPVKGNMISVSGIDDPDRTGFSVDDDTSLWREQIKECDQNKNNELYAVLLSHRPEAAPIYDKCSFDLVLCGHAHGGQVRIPYILNGLYAPNQGFFPKYAGGRYDLQNTTMLVSRGLAKSCVPRVFNRPELVIVDVKTEN